ncbi:hypothetical protein KIW84_020431 [Lathyrus oleraceus]|uniref:DUF7745 domain-containing protein n=1 Tax=Pisum sativum TaxID=3888 RepID=A0A9D4Y5N9_PEA|nr:hypothetical protein KIW84_020431 [Pisum sativum]
MPYFQNLKVLQGLMPNSIQRKFTLKYGRILDLLSIPVKVEAVTSLDQFYDPPMWCFLFQDFLLDPTLEEFGLYLDIPKDRKGPYMGIGQKVKPKELAVTLGIPTEDLLSHYKEDKDIQAYVPDIPDPIRVSIEEVDRLRATIVGLEQDKESLKHSLYDTTYEKELDKL